MPEVREAASGVCGLTMNQFIWLERVVSEEFLGVLLEVCPALGSDSAEAQSLRRIVEYALFAHPIIRDHEPELIVPFELVAEWMGVDPHSHGFNAGRVLEAFSDTVFDLRVTEHSYKDGRARTIDPVLPDAVRVARERELAGLNGRCASRSLRSLKPVSKRERGRRRSDYEAQLDATAKAVEHDHPAAGLLAHLASHSQLCLTNTLDRNLTAVREAAFAMPQETAPEARRRDAALRVLHNSEDNERLLRRLRYRTSEHTPRIHAIGNSIHLLPRELRKRALEGATSFDLRACQLAVVAGLWNIGPLMDFLRDGRSIWDELLVYLNLDPTYKPTLKAAIYSTLFGMSKRNLRRHLSLGTAGAKGIGEHKAEKFERHPLISPLLSARKSSLAAVRAESGARDAFGRWRPLADREERSVLAEQIQSYELRLMLAALPVIQDERDIHLLSWLHDGMAVKFRDVRRSATMAERLQEAVNEEARRLNIPTWLEREN